MKKVLRKVAILICITLVLPYLLNNVASLHYLPTVKAETSVTPKLVKTAGTMGVGCEPAVIQIENGKYDAEYTFTPANTKLVNVSASNGQGIIYSQGVGKTTITVKEIYQGITTEIGTYTITVVNAQIVKDKMEIGLTGYNTIRLNYENTNAAYKYKSSDSKVASVNADGYITGLKYGKATITVSEVYNGKTVKIGTCTVTVAKSKLEVTELEVPLYEDAYDGVPIACWNNKATYQYKSSDPKVVKVDKYGTFSGLKKGKSVITVTETLNKVSKKLGTITINVVLATIDPNCKLAVIGVNSSTPFSDMIDDYYNTIAIKNKNRYAQYSCKSADSSIVSVEIDNNTWDLSYAVKGKKIGTTTLTVYEEYKGKERTVGTIKVEVKEYPVTDFAFHLSGESGPQDTVTKDLSMGSEYYLRYFYYIRPFNCTTPVIFTSGDETIATVNSEGYLTPIKAGTVEITANCGSFTDKMIINIVEAE